MLKTEIVLLHKDMPTPEYKTSGSAGFDLTSQAPYDIVIGPGAIVVIATGVKVKLPRGYVGLLTPRSGKSITGFTVNNSPGIIDDDFRDEIKIIAANTGNDTVTVKKGERIAQLVCVRYDQLSLEVVDELSPDEYNDRVGGLGSTGSHG